MVQQVGCLPCTWLSMVFSQLPGVVQKQSKASTKKNKKFKKGLEAQPQKPLCCELAIWQICYSLIVVICQCYHLLQSLWLQFYFTVLIFPSHDRSQSLWVVAMSNSTMGKVLFLACRCGRKDLCTEKGNLERQGLVVSMAGGLKEREKE